MADRIVGIDAMTLVYAGHAPEKIDPNETPEERAAREALKVRAAMLFEHFYRDEATIVLPMIAVAEVLVPVPDGEKGLLLRSLSEKFVCAAFDMKAADIAARLWAAHKKLPQDQQYKDRIALKADAMIIATAKAAGAADFYSNDRRCRRLASLIMPSHGLPNKARDLEDEFIASDIRSGEGPPPRKPKAKKKSGKKKEAEE